MNYPSLIFTWRKLLFLVTKRRDEVHRANAIGAMNDLRQGEGRPPSWLQTSARVDAFFAGVQELSFSRNIPAGYVHNVLASEINYRRIIWYAGALEARKATFAEQQIAVADLVLEWWISQDRIERAMGLGVDDKPRCTF